MNATQLKGDLTTIEKTVKRADVPEPMKRLLTEILDWNAGLVDQLAKGGGNGKVPGIVEERLTALEADVEDLLSGTEEGIAIETAKIFMTAFEQAKLVNAAIDAFLQGPGAASMDDLAKKKFMQLVKASDQSIAVAQLTVAEITIPEEDDAPPAPEGDEDAEEEDDEGEDDEDAEDGDAEGDVEENG